jgi:DnaK suppressor protein
MTIIDTVDHDDWLAQIRVRLLQTQQTHRHELDTLTATAPDPADAATHAAFVARTKQAISDAAAALERIDSNNYGRCEVCGAVIPRERLEALPHARTCVACPRPA